MITDSRYTESSFVRVAEALRFLGVSVIDSSGKLKEFRDVVFEIRSKSSVNDAYSFYDMLISNTHCFLCTLPPQYKRKFLECCAVNEIHQGDNTTVFDPLTDKQRKYDSHYSISRDYTKMSSSGKTEFTIFERRKQRLFRTTSLQDKAEQVRICSNEDVDSLGKCNTDELDKFLSEFRIYSSEANK